MSDGILCDQEGLIKSFDKGSAEFFGDKQEDVLYKKRIFAFFVTNIVSFIKQWSQLNSTSNFTLNTVLRRNDGAIFLAMVSVVAQYNDKYRNYLVKIVPVEELVSYKSTFKDKILKWFFIIRINFLLATVIPLIFGIVWSLQYIALSSISVDLLVALVIGMVSCHIAANTFNDYFDWRSGADQVNTNYVMMLSGGSRAIDFGLIREEQLFKVALTSIFIASGCAFYLTIMRGPIILLLGGVGAFAAYFYTAPPIRLVARCGLGELAVFLCFGPLFVGGVIYVLTNYIAWESFFVGIPIGILLVSCLLINEYPDRNADLATNKNNLAVILGPKFALWAVVGLILASYCIIAVGIKMHIFPKIFCLVILTIPIALNEIFTVLAVRRNYQLVQKACVNNLNLYACVGVVFIVATIISLVNL